MSKDQIFGFAVISGVGVYVYGRSVAARMRARFQREQQIQLAKYRHPGSK
jgi:hypothetical protein